MIDFKEGAKILRNRWFLLAYFASLLPLCIYLADKLNRAGFLRNWQSCLVWIFTGLLGLYLATRRYEDQ